MLTLNNEEAQNISGGGKISYGVAIFLAALGSFIFGVIEGFANPKACNKR